MKSNQDKQTIQPLLPIYLIESNVSPLYHCCLGMFICYHLSESDQCNLDEKTYIYLMKLSCSMTKKWCWCVEMKIITLH